MRTWVVACFALFAASAGMAQLAIHRNPVPEARAESAAMGADRAEANRVARELGFDQAGSGSPLGASGGPTSETAAAPPDGSPLVTAGAEGTEPEGQNQGGASSQSSSEGEPLPRIGTPPGKRIEIGIPIPDERVWHARQWERVLASSTPAERRFERLNEEQWRSEQAAVRASWAAEDARRARAERDADRANEARWRRYGAVSRGKPTYVLR